MRTEIRGYSVWRSDSDMLSYCIAFPVSCKGEQIKQITYTINKGAFQIIGENPEKFLHTDDSIYRADNEFAKNFPKQGAAGKCSVLHFLYH